MIGYKITIFEPGAIDEELKSCYVDSHGMTIDLEEVPPSMFDWVYLRVPLDWCRGKTPKQIKLDAIREGVAKLEERAKTLNYLNHRNG